MMTNDVSGMEGSGVGSDPYPGAFLEWVEDAARGAVLGWLARSGAPRQVGEAIEDLLYLVYLRRQDPDGDFPRGREQWELEVMGTVRDLTWDVCRLGGTFFGEEREFGCGEDLTAKDAKNAKEEKEGKNEKRGGGG